MIQIMSGPIGKMSPYGYWSINVLQAKKKQRYHFHTKQDAFRFINENNDQFYSELLLTKQKEN